jgi:hypothetical protein
MVFPFATRSPHAQKRLRRFGDFENCLELKAGNEGYRRHAPGAAFHAAGKARAFDQNRSSKMNREFLAARTAKPATLEKFY